MKALTLLLLFFTFSCSSQQDSPPKQARVLHMDFGKYWYQGKAEIGAYSLSQQRYGQTTEGEAVLIFVTEDFSTTRLTKVDQPDESREDQLKVMKLNALRDFQTGVYPYHTMVSVFSPIYEQFSALKITVSVLEWCGMAFTTLKKAGGEDYHLELHSYFEQEEGFKTKLSGMPEDDVWIQLRLMSSPEDMPTGEKVLIPSLLRQRFTHLKPSPERARLEWLTDAVPFPGEEPNEPLLVYSISYLESGASIRIFLEASFPFKIRGWEEKNTSDAAFTRAVLKKDTLLDYWRYNQPDDVHLRSALGLSSPEQ
jgi:hypothetical protein